MNDLTPRDRARTSAGRSPATDPSASRGRRRQAAGEGYEAGRRQLAPKGHIPDCVRADPDLLAAYVRTMDGYDDDAAWEGTQGRLYAEDVARGASARAANAAAEASARASAPKIWMYEGEDPELAGLTVDAAAYRLKAGTRKYGGAALDFYLECSNLMSGENRDRQERGTTIGLLMEWVGPAAPDSGRWLPMMREWGALHDELRAIEDTYIGVGNIGEVAARVESALRTYKRLYSSHLGLLGEYRDFLSGTIETGKRVELGGKVVQGICFAALIAAATPVAVGVGASVSGGVGVQTVVTLGTAGVIGAGIEGATEVGGALLFESLEAMDAALSGRVDAIDWGLIGERGWTGMKEGFVDGVLAPISTTMAGATSKALAHAGKVLPGAREAVPQLLRRALSAALASGSAGAVTGSLGAGIKAAEAGKDLDAIVEDMRLAFVLSPASTAAGAVVGKMR